MKGEWEIRVSVPWPEDDDDSSDIDDAVHEAAVRARSALEELGVEMDPLVGHGVAVCDPHGNVQRVQMNGEHQS